MNLIGDGPLVTVCSVPFVAVILLWLLVTNVYILRNASGYNVLGSKPVASKPSSEHPTRLSNVSLEDRPPILQEEVDDDHPIRHLMHYADAQFRQYDQDRSRTFKETVEKYRRTHGRHPPPRFKEWYKFARKRQVHNIDDFQQIHDDLRPFWALPPAEIRRYAAHASDVRGQEVATISLRNGKVLLAASYGWRVGTFINMTLSLAQWLPDMDIPMNRMDQPRVVVPWDEVQRLLKLEESSRSLNTTGVADRFTRDRAGLWMPPPKGPTWLDRWNPFYRPSATADPGPEYGWIPYVQRPFNGLAANACPSESYARNSDSADSLRKAEASYKLDLGGLVANHNLSSDLCTVGPQLSELHGFLSAPVSMQATAKLIPIFSECKTSANNDILFPANVYWKEWPAFTYDDDDEQDLMWDDKNDTMKWRGSTSGGTTSASDPEHWHNMHRQRLALMTNSTVVAGESTSILALSRRDPDVYSSQEFYPANFAKAHTDVAFTEAMACAPNCDFYDDAFTFSNKTTFGETFRSKFLVDVDGHSFSGRWRAYLQSRSLGIKATIFREWHDSRLHAWRHFVPLDNRYDELWSILAYFVGIEADSPEATVNAVSATPVSVARHDYEAFKIAKQGRDWAATVLRREDIEIYLFRLLLEYGRIIDDDRDRIGVADDGGREMEDFDRECPAVA